MYAILPVRLFGLSEYGYSIVVIFLSPSRIGSLSYYTKTRPKSWRNFIHRGC